MRGRERSRREKSKNRGEKSEEERGSAFHQIQL